MCADIETNPENKNYRPVDTMYGVKRSHPIPCTLHGDPRVCLPGNLDAIEIFRLLLKHQNFIFREEARGNKNKLVRYLDLRTCLDLIRAAGAKEFETLRKLDILFGEINNE